MPDNLEWMIGAAVILLIAVAWMFLKMKRGPSIPAVLRPGQSLPDFVAADEQGNPVRSTQLIGSPTVMLFVRGNWCPFCTSQVADLTGHYKDIVDLGAKLIFVSPKPLETTRRVAEFFEVEFDIPDSMLPQVQDSAAEYGVTDASVLGAAIPVCGIAGDQQAALIGQAGFETGMTKSTYGTGCFVIANTGATALQSRNKLLTTVAYRLNGKVTYGIEGSIFVAGSALQWLRDQIKIIDSAGVSAAIAEETGIVENVHVVPAFAGLGAPYWDPDARGAILGLSRDSGISEIVTATLQAVAYQTKDLINAMADDGIQPNIIRVDGGMVANDWFLQFLADILNLTVERPKNVESTVLGAAYLAGLTSGIFASTEALQNLWRREALFEPDMQDTQRDRLYKGWLNAVARVKT